MSDPEGDPTADLLADAVTELYEADPDDFMPRRQELVARAREAGQPAVAKQIAALRKPTRSAWVVNSLVRADPEVTSRLAALAAELRGDEQSMDGARIRELTAARGRLVDELTRQALRVSNLPAPPAALREEVTATLDAAIADPEVAASLGTLVRAAHWSGFGLAPLAPQSSTASKAKPPPNPSAPSDPSDPSAPPAPASPKAPPPPAPAEAAAERARRHQDKIDQAERAALQADQTAASADQAEQDLTDTVRRLEAELADARQQLAEARRQSYRAESRQRRAHADLDRLRE
jgi:hypothetical protein